MRILRDSTTSRPKKRDPRRKDSEIESEVFKIENSSYRAKTGLRPNPNHIIKYKNHPYGKPQGERKMIETDENTLFQPLRIRYFTETMMEQKNIQNAGAIRFVEEVVLPRAAGYWSNALSTVPVDGNLVIDPWDLSNRQFCGDSEFSAVPQSHMTEGIPDADIAWYVSATPSSRFCGPSTLAVAVACNFDQFDRPTAGAINFCLDQIELDEDGYASPAITQDNLDVAIHEAAHVLGMSSNAFRFFYNSETGQPRTPRPFLVSTETCVDGIERTLAMPSEDTVKLGLASNGQRFANIVTPKVATVVRNHFDCQSLEGAQLENQPTGSESCIGDHWEERYFYPEALTSVMSPTTNVHSPLTLALMEDSGWYVANYTNAKILPWGHGVGCNFLSRKCLTIDGAGQTRIPDHGKGYFCNSRSARGCSPGQTHKMACTLLDYSLYYPPAYPPERFQYFADSNTLGGPEEVDYCPVFGSTYSGLKVEQLECSNQQNKEDFNIFSEFFGEHSMCFETNTGAGRCWRAHCDPEQRVLKINIRGTWYTCEQDFQKIDFKTNQFGVLDGKITCPRLSSTCPHFFCPVNCAGRGVCDWQHEFNGTIQPKCNCFNKNDTSPACTQSYVPDGNYLLETPSFMTSVGTGVADGLIAVFVDKPQTWSTTSWACAAGLLALFLVMISCICFSFCPDRKAKVKHTQRPRRSDRRRSSRQTTRLHHI